MITGMRVDLRKSDPEADDLNEVAQWGPERTIRPDVLPGLLTQVTGPQRSRALRLAGARIAGRLG
jgi:hypothetical protein